MTDDDGESILRHIDAILSAVRHPLIALSDTLRVEMVNPAFSESFETGEAEIVGRALFELDGGRWDVPELRSALDDARAGENVEDRRVEREFERLGRRVILVTVSRLETGRAGRLLLALRDETESERVLWELEGQQEFAEKIIDASRESLLILDWDLRVRTANETFIQTFRVPRGQIEGRLVYELGDGQWDIPELRDLLENVLPDDDAFDDFEVEHEFPNIGRRVMILNGRRLDHVQMILLAIEDVTERQAGAPARQESEVRKSFSLTLSDRLRQCAEPAQAIRIAGETLGRELGAAQVAYADIDAAGEWADIPADWSDGSMASNAGRHRLADYGPGLLADLRRGGRVVIGDVLEDPRTAGRKARETFEARGVRALINVPLHRDGRLSAVLAVHAAAPRKWTPLHARFATDAAERLWDAVARARAETALRRSEVRYRTLFERVDQGFCIFDMIYDADGRPVDYRFLEANPAFELLTGIANAVGKRMREIAPRSEEHWFEAYGRVAETGDPIRFEGVAAALGGRVFAVQAFRIGRPERRRVAALFRDVTRRRATETALRESEERFRVMVEAAAQAVWETDAEGVVKVESQSWLWLTGQSAGESLGHGWLDAVHPEDREATWTLWRAAIAAQEPVDFEHRVRTAGDGWGWTNVHVAPIRDRAGEVVKWVCMNIDVSERREAEETRKLLLGELNHRVKNIFAVIRSLARQGAPGRTAEEFRDVLLGRLDALTQAHELALGADWGAVAMDALAERALQPFIMGRTDSVRISGDPLMLSPRRAQTLALVLHELATNAVKHGALSDGKGGLRLEWRRRSGEVTLEWTESGGPAVTAPGRASFGTTLIAKVFDHELNGEARLSFEPEGFRFTARFPE